MAKAATKTKKKPAKKPAAKKAAPVKKAKAAKPAAKAKAAKPATKAKAAPKAKAKGKKAAKSTLFGGVAKGIAWIGDKVRGVVGAKPAPKKKAKKPKQEAAAPAPETTEAPVSEAPAADPTLVTLNNPLP